MIKLLCRFTDKHAAYLAFSLIFSISNLASSQNYDYWRAGNGSVSWPYGYGKDAVTACKDQQQKTGGWYAQRVLTQCKYTVGSFWNGCSEASGWNNNVQCEGKYCREGQFYVGPQNQCCPIGNVVNPDSGKCEGFIEDKNEPADPCKQTSAPVNFTTGNKTIVEVDLDPGTNPRQLQFVRIWSSYNQKWSFSYRSFIVKDSDYATLHRDNGEIVRFDLNYSISKAMPIDPDVSVELIKFTDGDLQYRSPSGLQETYSGATGKLKYFKTKDGKAIFVTAINATTVKIATADPGEPIIVLTLDAAGRVIAMLDPDNQIYRYKYREDGALEYVSYPDTTPDVSGSNPFGEDNPFQTYHYDHAANNKLITSITDANGDLYKTVVYDEDGRAQSSGFADGSLDNSTLDYSFIDDPSDPRVTVTNALEKDTIYHFDTLYGVRKVTKIDGVGTARCLADVQSRTYYPENGWLERSYDKGGVKTHYEYYADRVGTGSEAQKYGRIKTLTVAEDTEDELIFHYDWTYTASQTSVPLKVEAVGRWRSDFEYSVPKDQLLTRTDTDLTVGNIPYSTQGRTRIWDYRYDDYSDGRRLIREFGPRQFAVPPVPAVTSYQYSRQRYLTAVTNALGHTTLYQNHNWRGQPRRIVDPNLKITEITYTPRGWIDSIMQDVGGINAKTQFSYDHVGQLKRVTLADNTTFDYQYDAAHKLETITNAVGERIEYTLDAAGNADLISLKGSGGNLIQIVDYEFDELSRLFRELGADGQVTHFGYDGSDHLVSIDDGVNPPAMQGFDSLNRLRTVTDAGGNSISIAYDGEDNIGLITDQRDLSTNTIYDGFGNLKQVTSPDTGTTIYTYDVAGNRVSANDARGVKTNYTYDALNRLTNVTYPTDSSNNVTYTYDTSQFCNMCNGRLTAITDASGVTFYVYDSLGRVSSRVNKVQIPGGGAVPDLVTNFTYNAAGRLTAVQYPNGQIVNYTLDAAGQVTQVTRQDSATATPVLVASAIVYQPFGPLKDIKYGNNLQLSRTYDLDGRLVTQAIAGKQDLLYDYDAVNNVKAISNSSDPSRSEVFTYDALNRLDTATGKYGAIDYDYDAVGNRTLQSTNRQGLFTTETYQYPLTSNRLDRIDIRVGAAPAKIRKFTYDNAGNVVDETRADGTHRRAHFDTTNRMDSVTP